MALKPGTCLGPYEILAPLGAGGMGEVYRARDTRLGREVAIKVLPQSAAATVEDRARFAREAKTISALNHPYICVLHDVGREGETDYLVMELVEGETLAVRIARAALPIPEVLRIGSQIADALDRAHRAGVVHRDLKPGNVMLTKGGAKLMDFGLARESRAPAVGPESATVTEPARTPGSEESITKKGMIVGTFQYMAPEQLEGNRADERSDLWSLGCVLYEAATGQRAFDGTSPLSVISAILRAEPREMRALSPLTPPAFERSVKQCLAKNPDERWQSAGDLRRELDWIAQAGGQVETRAATTRPKRVIERLIWVAIVAVAVLATVLFRPKPTVKSAAFELTTPPQVSVVDLPRISPDGSVLAFNATDSTGVARIWVRPIRSLEARAIPRTEGAGRPFWAPDSRSLAYFAGGRLMRVDLSGGPPVPVCDVGRAGDGSWSSRGFILFDYSNTDSVMMVPASGGTPVGATRRDPAGLEAGSAWPQFLPDGRHFLYLAYGRGAETPTLKVGSIVTKKTTTLGPIPSRVEFATGHLLYVNAGTLVARPFDPRGLKFTGGPVAIAQGVGFDIGGGAQFSVSSEGTIVYHSKPVPGTERLEWLDRRGSRIGKVGPPGYYESPALSPDGTRLAVDVTDPTRQAGSVWIWDLHRDKGIRLTQSGQRALAPAWSPDGRSVAYGLWRGVGFDLMVQSTAGVRAESLFYDSPDVNDVTDWSPDGKWIVYMRATDAKPGDVDIFAISTTDPGHRIPILTSQALEVHSALAPGGGWLAYESLESGNNEILVRTFPQPGYKRRVSAHGGMQPSWRGDGRELYYLTPEGALMAVSVEPGAPPRFSEPTKLFDAPIQLRGDTRNQYVPARDGRRFLFAVPEGPPTPGTTSVRLNWPAMLGE